jgi:hypothetical protein
MNRVYLSTLNSCINPLLYGTRSCDADGVASLLPIIQLLGKQNWILLWMHFLVPNIVLPDMVSMIK